MCLLCFLTPCSHLYVFCFSRSLLSLCLEPTSIASCWIMLMIFSYHERKSQLKLSDWERWVSLHCYTEVQMQQKLLQIWDHCCFWGKYLWLHLSSSAKSSAASKCWLSNMKQTSQMKRLDTLIFCLLKTLEALITQTNNKTLYKSQVLRLDVSSDHNNFKTLIVSSALFCIISINNHFEMTNLI